MILKIMRRKEPDPMTPTAVLEREGAPPPMYTKFDEERLAEIREERFLVRKAKHEADRNLNPWLLAYYLDREIWDTDQIARFLGYADSSLARVSEMRDGRARIVPTSLAASLGMSPAILPGMDISLGVAWGRHRPGTEKGRVIEWALKDHRMVFNPMTGELVPNHNFRTGRVRHNRETLGPNFVQARAARIEKREKHGETGLAAPRRVPRKQKPGTKQD